MKPPKLGNLLSTPMTRGRFLVVIGLSIGSFFGVTGFVKQLMSHAATPYQTLEPESGTQTGTTTITDSLASSGQAIKFGSGSTTPPAGSSSDLVQPVWSRTTVMTDLSTSNVDNTPALNAYLASATTNTKLIFPNHGRAEYRFSQNIDINKPGIGIFGGTTNAADTILLSTDQQKHGYRVYGNNHFAKNFTHRVQLNSATGRSDQNEQGASTLLLQTGVDGFRGEDLVLDSAAAAGFFAYGAVNYKLNRCTSQNSLADSFHNTRGCINGAFTDCIARNGGDDGFAVVQYGNDPSSFVSYNIAFTRCKSYTAKARAFSAISVHDVDFKDCYAESSYSPGLYIGREFNNTSPVDAYNITTSGQFTARNCCTGTDQGNNGAVFLLNGDNTARVRDITLNNVVLIDTPVSNNGCVRALSYGNGVINANLNNFRFYGTAPGNGGQPQILQNVAGSQSNLSLNGWENVTPLVNGNYTGTVHPLSEAPKVP